MQDTVEGHRKSYQWAIHRSQDNVDDVPTIREVGEWVGGWGVEGVPLRSPFKETYSRDVAVHPS